ncbi:MAG: hypothetical protein WCK65_06800, partial [Rhodospirillaceae bacterium]
GHGPLPGPFPGPIVGEPGHGPLPGPFPGPIVGEPGPFPGPLPGTETHGSTDTHPGPVLDGVPTIDHLAPPPNPNGYVNTFISPLYDGTNGTLDFHEVGPSFWTLPIGRNDVDLATSTFTIPAALVGTWDGGIPPEARYNPEDNTYTIHSWPITNVQIVNLDGQESVILTVHAVPSELANPV